MPSCPHFADQVRRRGLDLLSVMCASRTPRAREVPRFARRARDETKSPGLCCLRSEGPVAAVRIPSFARPDDPVEPRKPASATVGICRASVVLAATSLPQLRVPSSSREAAAFVLRYPPRECEFAKTSPSRAEGGRQGHEGEEAHQLVAGDAREAHEEQRGESAGLI